jgi:hypothetical protein
MPPTTQINIRRDTAANFTSANPTLALGEIAFETDTRNFKVGNGVTAWTSLAYATNYRGNAAAPTSNVTLGPSAGASLNAAATHSTMIGSGAGDAVRASDSNVAIGRDALGSFVSGALLITTTAAGSGGTAGTYTVPLTKDSGDGEMSVYPTISATVGAGGTVTSTTFTTNVEGTLGLTSPGSNPSVQSGIIFRPADPVPVGFPSNFRCRLDSVQGNCVAIGQDALLLNSTGRDNICIGQATGDAITTAQANICIGRDAGTGLTTGNGNVIVGTGSATAATNMGGVVVIGSQSCPSINASSTVVIGNRSGFSITTNAGSTTIIGSSSVQSSSAAPNTTSIGGSSLRGCTSTQNTTAIGSGAGRYIGSGTTEHNGTCNNNLLIGYQARCSAVGTTNEVVIGAIDALGNGSNTTTIGNTSTTGTFIPAGNLTLSSHTGGDSNGLIVKSGTADLRIQAADGAFGDATVGTYANVPLNIKVNSARVAQFQTSGNVRLDNGNLILGTSGNGISFAATSDPSIPAVAAAGTIIGTATNVANNDTVTLGASTYTFKTTLTPANGEVLIGADAAASLLNLARAINNSGGTPGTDYQVAAANASASAGTIVGSTIPLTALTAGTAGNSIALAETSAQLSVSGATLLGGRAAGGSDSEILSDYEQGTWTPGFTFVTPGNLVVPYTSRNGYYVKVGRMVTVWGEMRTASSGIIYSTASGGARVTGLPYAGGSSLGGISVYPNSGFAYFAGIDMTGYLQASISQAGTDSSLRMHMSRGLLSALDVQTTQIPSGTVLSFNFCVTYPAA